MRGTDSTSLSPTDFWQDNQVAEPVETFTASMAQLLSRAETYPELEKLMPTYFPGARVLDFGCGPGHDTIQFIANGAKHVWFADISWKALKMTNDRLKLHDGFRSRTTPLFADDPLPLVDHVHCAGVLHHMHDPLDALLRMRRVSPSARIMVYDGKRSEHTQSLVPITEWWTPKEFVEMCAESGWKALYEGSYECSAPWRPNCFAACFSLT